MLALRTRIEFAIRCHPHMGHRPSVNSSLLIRSQQFRHSNPTADPPTLEQFDYKTITAADTTVVHKPPSPTTSDVAMLKVSFGFESVHVSYILEASFSA